MKHHSRLFTAFLAFLLIFSNHLLAQKELHEVKGYVGISPLPQEVKQGSIAFTMPVPKRIKIIKLYGKKALKKYKKKVPLKKEGYYLHICNKEIVLAAYDEAGLFYAEQTLNQILAKGGSILKTDIVDWPSVDCRGSIEGFYGNPWSHQDRLCQFDFYGKNKMNTYVYGPKDDPFHRYFWRDPYPEKEGQLIKELVKKAKENYVQFVWAVHPGIDIRWEKDDSLNIVKKLESVYKLGVRSFAVFFDDISGEGTKADKQAGLMNYITDNFVKKHKDVNPLIICPTQYNKGWSHGDYLNTLGTLMYPEIRIMWTGNSVVDMIEENDMEWINNQINRKAFIWLNYPVNDYCQSRILMGKTYGNGKNIAEMVSGFCSNPMEYAEASKISLYSIADYTWNMSAYDAQKSWERAINTLMPTSKEAFKIFCENNVDLGVTGHGLRREGESEKFLPFLNQLSQPIESKPITVATTTTNSKGKIVPLDEKEINRRKRQALAKQGFEATQKLCQDINLPQMKENFNELIWAAHTLLNDSVNQPEMMREIAPWVQAMYYAGVRGMDLVEEAEALLNKNDDRFILTYSNYRHYEDLQKNLRSRDFEGSIVTAQPAFSGDVITPLLKQFSDTLNALYKMQYREHWDVFPTGVIPDGDYYILFDGKMLTDSLASPTRTGDYPVFLIEKDVINPQRQLWHFAYNEKMEAYNITNVQDGRYLNESGLFWRDMEINPFDPQYHSFIIKKSDNSFSIQQTAKGGKSYWNCDGRRIITGNSDNHFVFQIISVKDFKK